ncbi:hypothetical protein [Methanosphaera sp. BMS]|uniref:hypothetical protein n=1 Tax=Methanosphaera sp. BMS TaxID=1789762 RepID=UPI000DC1CE53|nr:hypothetical protein [Methanosphaera sp. BMS]AWX31716.1 hypothetical protein AW729_00820 [Methanosphaera sp. BMS]
MKIIMKMLFVISLIFLFVGVSSASDISIDAVSTDTSDLSNIIMNNTAPETSQVQTDLTKESKESKEIKKEDKNLKTSSKTYAVNNYNTLEKALTENTYSNVTLNIISNIKLTNNLILNKSIHQLNINGNGKTINGDNKYQFMEILENSTVKINNLNIRNCHNNNSWSGGGAIYNKGTLSITNSSFNNNYARYGGAIYNYYGDITIKNSTLNNNNALDGGAIYTEYGNFTINNSTLNNNNAADDGGVICIYRDNLTITGSILNNNNAKGFGGAIYNAYGTLTINNNIISNDKSCINGGAIYNYYGNSTIYNTILNKNNVKSNGTGIPNYYTYCGGAIYNSYGNVTIYNSELNNNKVYNNHGGAIYNNANLNIINSVLFNNSNAGRTGGAIFNYYANLTIINSKLNNNNANHSAGAIYNSGNATIKNSTINNNSANGKYWEECGGAIRNCGNLNINNSILNNNKADYDGGAIYNFEGNVTLTNSILNNNFANNTGGAIRNCGNLTIIKGNLNNNKATGSYGGGAILNGHVNGATLNIIESNLYNNTANSIGGAIRNWATGNISINKCTFSNNNANGSGGVISNAGNLTISKSTLKNNNAGEYGGAIYTNGLNNDISYNKFIDNNARSGSAIYNVENNCKIRYNNFTANKASNTGYSVNNNGKGVSASGNVNYYGKKYPSTIQNYGNNVIIIGNRFEDTVKLISTTTTVETINGIVGEKLKLIALVKDNTGTPVDGGRVIFKLNGITLKDNGKLSGSNNPLKVYVSNGEAVTNIITDLSMKNVTKFTASFIGTNIYSTSNSSTAKVNIKLRTASIIVSTNVKTIKQGQVLTITAKVYDTTNGGHSSSLVKYADEFVYFKVNGITLKDNNGQMLKVKIVNGVATTKYTIPLGLSGVTDGKTMTPKNHTILAGFYNKNYQENIRNTSTFQVERSNITITIANATVNNKTHKLSLTATIKDYMGNIVKGPNKCVIKINGVSLKNGTEAMYYYSTNGILNVKNINIPSYNKYTNIEIVTQDRLAYKSQRNSTTKIKITN